MNNFPRVFLNRNEEQEIIQGCPWVFDNEISHVKYREGEGAEWKTAAPAECGVENGSGVELYTKAGGFLGTGIFNANSRITVRLISREHGDKVFENPKNFWDKRIRDAANIRRVRYSERDSYRVVFGEADFVPGLICDRYCDTEGRVYLVVQFQAMACEVFRREIVAALKKTLSPFGIYERSDAAVREKEGLRPASGWIGAERGSVIHIPENGIDIAVDLAGGQKTGFFLDQKENRLAAAAYCRGKRVLDAFSHTGAFGLNAVKAGAREVIAADSSGEALSLADENIRNNGAAGVMKTVCADVFDLLKKYEADGEKFDVIILDPPAFAKSAKTIEKAYGGYKEINLRAMRLLNDGGILVTCSCSYFFDARTFYDMLTHAAADSRRQVQVLEKRGASSDHPVLLGHAKSEYLKCAVCRVL